MLCIVGIKKGFPTQAIRSGIKNYFSFASTKTLSYPIRAVKRNQHFNHVELRQISYINS